MDPNRSSTSGSGSGSGGCDTSNEQGPAGGEVNKGGREGSIYATSAGAAPAPVGVAVAGVTPRTNEGQWKGRQTKADKRGPYMQSQWEQH